MRNAARCILVVLLAAATAAQAIEVPLTFTKHSSAEASPMLISSVAVSRSPLIESDASAPCRFDFNTSTATGLSIWRDAPDMREQGGRKGATSYMSLTIDDPSVRSGSGDLYVAIEYYDTPTTHPASILIRQRAKREDGRDLTLTRKGPELAGSGTWKRFVFQVEKVTLPDKKEDSPDFSLYADYVSPFRAYGNENKQLQAEPPAGEWKLPKLNAKVPAYAMIELGETSRLAILDKEQTTDTFYTRLFFDANMNRDLTDDTILTATSSGDRRYASFPTVVDVSLTTGGPVAYSVRFSAQNYGPTSSGDPTPDDFRNRWMHLSAASNCYYAGKFDSDGKTYYVALGDADVDGKFNDLISVLENYSGDTVYFRGDKLYVSQNAEMVKPLEYVLGHQLLLGKKLYDMKVEAGPKLVLNEVSGALGTLKLPMPLRRLQLVNDQRQSVMCVECGDTLQLPEAQYAFTLYSLERAGSDGTKWSLDAAATADTTATRVQAGSTAQMAMGEPFSAFVDLPEWERQNIAMTGGRSSQRRSGGGIMSWFRSGDRTAEQPSMKRAVNIEFVIEGAGMERVQNLELLSGKPKPEDMSPVDATRPREPSYKIMKPDGELLTQGTFEYG